MEKTNTGLVAYAKAQLGKPYWYGTFGQAASRSLYNQKKNQYPSYYKWEYAGETAKVHDCVGLIKGYLWCDSPEDNTPVYNAAQDISANGMRDVCAKKGAISSIPEVPGVLVFMNNHVGVYIGNGEVIEARGHAYGVVKTKLKNRAWTQWGYCPYIEYEEAKKPESVPIVKNAIEVDGKWGSATTKRLQQIFGTTVDGEVSNQYACYKDQNPGLRSGWEWVGKPNGKGSQLIKAMQKWAGMPAKDQDGEVGPKTIKAFQTKLGTTVDGRVSNPSQMVKALQKWANEQ